MTTRRAVLVLATILLMAAPASLRPQRAHAAGATTTLTPKPGPEAISLHVFDAGTGAPLPARVVVRDAADKAVKSEYEHLPGVFTGEDGSLEMPLAPGRYSLEVLHGIDYVSQSRDFAIGEGKGVEARVFLEPWVRLRPLGWANGDAHAHLYSDTPRDEKMTATVRRICRAQGVDFICACQTWAGYGDADWREGYAKVSDARFRLLYGAEMPKYRTGHTFWYGLDSTRGAFQGAMDEVYENAYYQAPKGTEWTFDTLPFPNIPDLELITRFRSVENAATGVPHPTSWWWQPRGDVEKYVTNVAVSLPAGLLAGRVWDGMAVMGYDRDHYFYEDLWFHALDEGYRLAALGELDGGFPPSDRFYYGRVRTYVNAGADVTLESVARAVRAQHTFVTSGPVVLASVDGRYQPGDVVPADGAPHTLRLEAFASGEREDRLSYVVLFRNSRVHEVWDLRSQDLRRFETQLALRETDPAWYVLKAYGRTARTPEQLDVRAVVDQITNGRFAGTWSGDSAVALTSPFYFRRPGTPADPPAFVSHVRVRLVDGGSGRPVGDATVRVQVEGRTVATQPAPSGTAELRVPVNAVLVLDAPGRPTLRRVLYLDYPPQRRRVESLANGHWLDDFGGRVRLKPGQVPWAAFDLAGTKADLAEVDWTVPWVENERDPLWNRFEAQLR